MLVQLYLTFLFAVLALKIWSFELAKSWSCPKFVVYESMKCIQRNNEAQKSEEQEEEKEGEHHRHNLQRDVQTNTIENGHLCRFQTVQILRQIGLGHTGERRHSCQFNTHNSAYEQTHPSTFDRLTNSYWFAWRHLLRACLLGSLALQYLTKAKPCTAMHDHRAKF